MKYLNTILTVPTTDPDDARQRRLLNILLLGTLIAALIGLVAIVIFSIFNPEIAQSETQVLLIGIVVFTLGIFGIYQVNRRLSGRWAALLFLLLLTVIFVFTDTPQELVRGRSLFLFTIPITIASLILAPQASFLFAAISGAIVAWLGATVGLPVNIFVVMGFFILALVSWLSARSLEAALQELRAVNAGLDQLVAQRTQALAESLDRERIEAGRNRAILNSIADGVIVFDRNWNATLANPAVRSMLDFPLELIIDKNFSELIDHPKLGPKSRGLLSAMMEHDT
ncbi:MAG TPA: PAS domain-containing protein, partial [Anaerolineales bacterium]|nr:PAS domain-containing protein [Anaerolineales bacterium]